MSNKLTVVRRYTTPENGPFEGIVFETRRAVIYNSDGSVNFEMDDIEVPADWDQVAVDVLASKYFRKRGVPQVDAEGSPVLDEATGEPILGAETSARQWALRLADAWKIWGERGGYFATDDDALAFRDEMAYMLITQMGSPNSPQHFNTGLFEAYGIVAEPEGNWYYDETTAQPELSAHRYERSAVSACYIQSVQDKLVGEDSIFDLWEREARLFKSGSGTGSNFSALRGAGEPLSGGGVSSGVMSWLKIGDAGAGSVASGGTTRRAAKMVILDADHPQITEFVESKVIEERKAAALIAGGFSGEWNAPGGAYDSIAYQNGNHSVRLPEGFLQAVADDADWHLTARTDGSVVRTLPARELWDQIATAAWDCADPGVQFDDLINDWNTAPGDGRLRGTNPCSEYVHLDDTACNLASLRLTAFVDPVSGEFDADSYLHATRLFTIALEISVSMAHYPSAKLAFNSYEHRTLGLGYCDLGALLMTAGLPYDSSGGRAAMAALTSLMHSQAYVTSAELAAAVGPAPAYQRNSDATERVIRNHARAAHGTLAAATDLGPYEALHVLPVPLDHTVLADTPFAALSPLVRTTADLMVSMGRSGRRNMQVTALAPTGTIGLQMGCATTGIEPDFALVKFKKLAGGGVMKIVNGSVPAALRRLGYSHEAISSILTHALGTASLDGPTAINRDSLLAHGLSTEAIARVAAELPRAMTLTQAFAPHTVGLADLLALGIEAEQLEDPGFDLLAHLGYTPTQVAASTQVICGHHTIEGAPELNPSHLAVFDTASYCGDGTRVISPQGHVRALGAVAPFLSGSTSKTVNLPNQAAIADIRESFELAYALGVKCVAVYRDGSKHSQVLTSQTITAPAANEDLRLRIEDMEPGISPSAFYHGSAPPRFRLPNQRFGPTWKISVGGTELFLHVGEYPDGTAGEIFCDILKEGSTLSGILKVFCISVSHGLQYGVPLAKLVDAFTFHSFPPAGMVTGDPNLKMASSIIDAIFKLLGYHYLGDESLVQVTTSPPTRVDIARVHHAPTPQASTQSTAAPTTLFESSGNTCDNCGGVMIRSGTCSRCLNCGETSGCS